MGKHAETTSVGKSNEISALQAPSVMPGAPVHLLRCILCKLQTFLAFRVQHMRSWAVCSASATYSGLVQAGKLGGQGGLGSKV